VTAHEFRASVRRALQLLAEIELAQDLRVWDSLTPSTAFQTAAFSPEVPYRDLFVIGLNHKDYNAVLTD
jgi:hypothetical protein